MRTFLIAGAVVVFLAALGFAAVGALYAYYARELPNPEQLARMRTFQTARILDRNGTLLQEITDPTGGRRTSVALASISPWAREAAVAAEDATFYENPGFDPRAIGRAVLQWVLSGSPQSGASTITEQLVKNTLLGPQRTAERKIKEAFLAIEVTRRYSKDQILEMYLNDIFYGNHAYGIEAASETYFGVHAAQLTLGQASFLAGLPQAPASYDPYTRLDLARERQRYVLDQMVRAHMISPDQASRAAAEALVLRPDAGPKPVAADFVALVRQQLEQRFGSDALETDGLTVSTTLDVPTQQALETALRQHAAELRGAGLTDATFVAMRAGTGQVLALAALRGAAGGRSGSEDTQAAHPIGPMLQPFIYLDAFAKGWNPATLTMDVAGPFSGGYRPLDADGREEGPLTARQALARGRLIPAVQALAAAGAPQLLKTVRDLGLPPGEIPAAGGLSLAQDAGRSDAISLTAAYAVLAGGGRAPASAPSASASAQPTAPALLLRVTDLNDADLFRSSDATRAAFDQRLVYQVQSILADPVARASEGPDLGVPGREVAAFAGSAAGGSSRWIEGFTPDVVLGIWAGSSGGATARPGASAAVARAWRAGMASVVGAQPPHPFAAPPGIVQADVCALSGLLPTPSCVRNDLPIHGTIRDVFVPGVNLPTTPDNVAVPREVCRATGELATQLVPANARETRIFAELPAPYRSWGEAHGYPSVPTATCSSVYRGVRLARIVSPSASEPVAAGPSLAIVGAAAMDDFHSFTVQVGPGESPDTWSTLADSTQPRPSAGPLATWYTRGQPPGIYTLRLRVYDSLGNSLSATAHLTLAEPPTPTATPTPAPTPGPTSGPTTTPGPGASPAAGTSAATVGPRDRTAPTAGAVRGATSATGRRP